MANEKILVVDDEEHILELIKFNLESAGYQVVTAENGEDALRLCSEEKPDLVLLDIMLPGIDGLEVCRRLKSQKETMLIPIIMITAKGEEVDKIIGLELGADDYITKPFSIKELLARISSVLRRYNINVNREEEVLTLKDITLDLIKHEVTKDGVKLDLTLKEFDLLKILLQNKGKVLSRNFLLDKIWGYEFYGETRTVDVHIRYLRKKIEGSNSNEKYIETIRGIGYKIE